MKHETESRLMAKQLFKMAQNYIEEEKQARIFFTNILLSLGEEFIKETEGMLNGRMLDENRNIFIQLIRHEENMEMRIIRLDRENRRLMRYVEAHAIRERK